MAPRIRVLGRTSTSGFLLRWTFITCTLAFVLLMQHQVDAVDGRRSLDEDEDNDFAEFDFDDEEFERVDEKSAEDGPKKKDERVEEKLKANIIDDDEEDEDEAIVEDEDEFGHFNDDEEFEGFNEDPGSSGSSNKKQQQQQQAPKPPKAIKITDVPAHLRNNWESYYLEILMTVGIVVYFINFFTGKSKNQKIATSWFESHRTLLESNFALVGDDGAKNVEEIQTQLVKESEHGFTLWCSGRVGCDGLLVEIKLLKRQDIVSLISNMMKPASDQVEIKVNMQAEDMDTFVFCIASKKKTAARLAKEMNDIATFCPERKSADKFGAPADVFSIMSEIPEASASMMDSKMTAMLNKYPDVIDSIHFSDQYTGVKLPEDQQPVELPQGKKVLIFTFNIPVDSKANSGKSIEEITDDMKPLLMLVFYFMDKVKRYRLSRDAKAKADKNRAKVAEAFWKAMHVSRAERAQEERERKRREIKEKIKEIEDPEKQRKLEERENRRDKKKNQPKMKQMKIKAM